MDVRRANAPLERLLILLTPVERRPRRAGRERAVTRLPGVMRGQQRPVDLCPEERRTRGAAGVVGAAVEAVPRLVAGQIGGRGEASLDGETMH